MRGFMCQSVEVTSGCTISDTRNVIVPRRILGKNDHPLESTRLIEIERARLKDRPKDLAEMTRKNGSLVVKQAGKRAEQGHAKSSMEIVPRTAPLSANAPENVFQVVVMRVSLHCQGCAGKVKKHLSKMEGVTSFSIDLEEKRVTVMGHVSPIGVLESISKVKRAEFWAPPPLDEFGIEMKK